MSAPPAGLQHLLGRFHKRLTLVESAFSDHIVSRPVPLRHRDRMFLDGLISITWQYWCRFCRQLVLASALGCQTRRGATLVPSVSPPIWQRVSYVAIRAANGKPILPNKTESLLRREPTWGDVAKLPLIVSGLAPQNGPILINTFGSVTQGPVHLQIVRNASAHLNEETHREILNLRPFYNPQSVRHPTDVTVWTEPVSQDYAFISWVDDMRLISDLATDY